MKPMKLLLPGFFLLSLGIGNLAVGLYKAEQYKEVLKELSSESPTPLLNASPLKRIQAAEQTASKAYQRNSRATARLDFYQLVAFGGKVLIGLSLLLFIAAAFESAQRSKEGRKENEAGQPPLLI